MKDNHTFADHIVFGYETIKKTDPQNLSEILIKEYLHQVPTNIDTPDDLDKIGNLLGELTNARTYLTGIHTMLQAEARIAKRNKSNKLAAEDLAIKRDIVAAAMESVKNQYDACSRMLSAHKMQVDELRMLGDGPRYRK